jgi:hypothetical protein
MDSVLDVVAVLLARLNAEAASDALVGLEEDLLPGVLTFRVVAPEARKGTAFQENSGPYARPVMDRESLDIEEESLCH